MLSRAFIVPTDDGLRKSSSRKSEPFTLQAFSEQEGEAVVVCLSWHWSRQCVASEET